MGILKIHDSALQRLKSYITGKCTKPVKLTRVLCELSNLPLHDLCKSSYVPGLSFACFSAGGGFVSIGGGAVRGGGGGIEVTLLEDEGFDGEAASTFPIFDRVNHVQMLM